MYESLTKLKNIGNTVAMRLNEIGVSNRDELERIGAGKAYQRLSTQNPSKRLPVCYYLYSLEGAIQGRHWGDFSGAEKAELRKEAGLDS